MGFGVDAIYGVQFNPQEFLSLVGLGVPEMEALQMATINSATLLDLQDELGSIEPGKLADLIVLSGDPLADPDLLRELVVEKTLIGGVVFFDRQET